MDLGSDRYNFKMQCIEDQEHFKKKSLRGTKPIIENTIYNTIKQQQQLLAIDVMYSLMSLSEKKRRFNHLQMLEQSENLLLNYFKTLSNGLTICV